jgi:putative SOS response-associated peptidase YedK
MCGRFCIAASPGEIMERYHVQVPSPYKPRYNLAPGQKCLAITWSDHSLKARMIEWGFLFWVTHRVINARIESLHEKPMFRNLFQKNRCLIPASGYYEWKHSGNQRIPYYFSLDSDTMFSFAGLIHPSNDGDEAVIITTQATHPYNEIHDRMPVILNPADEQKYLESGEIIQINTDLTIHEVSHRVNSVSEEGPDLIRPWVHREKQQTLSDIG